MIGLTAVVYSCFQIVSCWGSLSLRRKITVNGFFIQRLQTFFMSRFLRFLTFFILGETFFSSMLGGTFTYGLYDPRKGDELPACNRAIEHGAL